MDSQLKVFIGYDPKEEEAWSVCSFSILRHANEDVTTHPLKLNTLRELGLYTRELDKGAATEFSISRFLTPYLNANEGWVIFVDCDFLFTVDIKSVLVGLDHSKAVYVVKHDYTPSKSLKMDGAAQSIYPRKNWSSFMAFNCSHPDVKSLTPDIVNSATPKYLHRFEWIKNDDHIGELPLTWNFLEGEYEVPKEIPNAIHYTNGGPWFEDWQNVDFAEEWRSERNLMRNS
jgi:hypothetical protein